MSDFSQPKKGSRLELAYLHGGEAISQSGEALGPRVLGDFELVYAIDGWITYLSDGISYAVPPGGFILGRPGLQETYHWDPQIPTRHAFFHFGIEGYPQDWPKPEHWPRMRTSLSQVCVSLFRHILQIIYTHDNWPLDRPGRSETRFVEALLDAFIGDQRGETVSFERDRPEPVRRALMLMRKLAEENPAYPLTLAEAAAQAHVTEKHLCRLFSSSLGYSPMQTFTLLKLQATRPLLTRTNLSVKEIAERCGFENPLYFSRLFSQTYGCPPSSFREQLRHGKMVPPRNILPVDLMSRAQW
jgi:AraC-like DNA-binding protein